MLEEEAKQLPRAQFGTDFELLWESLDILPVAVHNFDKPTFGVKRRRPRADAADFSGLGDDFSGVVAKILLPDNRAVVLPYFDGAQVGHIPMLHQRIDRNLVPFLR